MAAIQALILDYGGVLSWPQPDDWFQIVAERLGVAPDAFHAAYWHHRPAYDAGLHARDYWRRVLDMLSPSRAAVSVEVLIQMDVASWTEYRDELWSLAQSFRVLGGRTAFLSNGVPEVMARIRADRSLESWFDVVVVSCEVGAAKPDPLIYEICLSRLGVDADQALFVDDRLENVEGAAKLGIRTLHFTAADTMKQLAHLTSRVVRS